MMWNCSQIIWSSSGSEPGQELCPKQCTWCLLCWTPTLFYQQELDLSRCTLDDSCFRDISKLQLLKRLVLSGTPVSTCRSFILEDGQSGTNSLNSTTDSLRILPHLEFLDLHDTKFLLEEGIGRLFGAVQTLLLGSDNITPKDLRTLSELENLQVLDLQVWKSNRFSLVAVVFHVELPFSCILCLLRFNQYRRKGLSGWLNAQSS